MTITELAHRIGVTTAYLADIEKRPNKRPPTPQRVHMICEALDLDQDDSTMLKRLATEGRLPAEFRDQVTVKIEVERPPKVPRELMISETEEEYLSRAASLPLLAEVPAGDPQDVHDEVIEERPVPRSIARPGRYLLQVSGKSMQPLLGDGDIVLVDSVVQPVNKSIVAARIADDAEDQSTIKQLRFWPDRVILHPLNPDFDDIILIRTGDLDETGTEFFELDGRRVRLFLKGTVAAIVWRDLSRNP